MDTFTYYYHAGYGSPELEPAEPRVAAATVSPDGLTVRLTIDKLVLGHIHALHLPGVRDRKHEPLLHDVAYYTLNQIPHLESP